jgi:hypothetical protein
MVSEPSFNRESSYRFRLMETSTALHISRDPLSSSRLKRSLTASVCALLALLPLFWNWEEFSRLIWFGDDYDLLNQIRKVGFIRWVVSPFAENFIPVFKVFWGAALSFSAGDYRYMISMLWLTHALNAFLLSLLISRLGASPLTALGAAGVFALSSSLHETLGWSVQWSAILCTTFYLLGLHTLLSSCRVGQLVRWQFGVLVGCAALSVFSFSRGMVVCGAFTCGGVVAPLYLRRPCGRWWVAAGVCLLPAIVAAVTLFVFADGNHQKLFSSEGQKLFSMVQFALTALALNPLDSLSYGAFSAGSISLAALALGLCVKALLALLALYFIRLEKPAVVLVFVLLLFDFGNALLLGIGRYHTGQAFALSSRYQYEFLLTFLVIAALALEGVLSPLRRMAAAVVGVAAILAWFCVASGWPTTAKEWTRWRGQDGAQAVRELDAGQEPAQRWIGFPSFMPYEELKAVRQSFNLTPR